MSRPAVVGTSLAWLDQSSLRLADRIVDAAERFGALVSRRVPETVIVFIALATRFSMLVTYNPAHGYDSPDHMVYAQWFAHHLSLPALMLCRETYHPPLYYLLEGGFSRLVQGRTTLFALPSMLFSTATLLLTWFGMERHL